jgi:tagatose-1,6-bisphosphate aldolase
MTAQSDCRDADNVPACRQSMAVHGKGYIVNVALSSVQAFLCGLAIWVDTLVSESDKRKQKELQNDIALVYITACNRINKISIFRDHNNNP